MALTTTFECIISKRYDKEQNIKIHDCASSFIFPNEKFGVEYLFCRHNGEDASAIYKVTYNDEKGCYDKDYSTFVYYSINFADKNWKRNLSIKLKQTLISFL